MILPLEKIIKVIDMENKYSEFMTEGMKLISDEEFKLIRDLVYEKVGIHLTEQKKALVTGRLQKVVKDKGFNTFAEYYQYIISDRSGQALSELVDKISTNHTFFGREFEHFEHFQKVALPEIVAKKLKQNNRDIRIWSAGCSTGEEPYTLVILMKEYFGSEYSKWDAGVLATDISTVALSKAIAGIYDQNRLHNFDPVLRDKYFIKHNDTWVIKDEVKREVTFKRFNLMNDVFPFKKPFDVIFCRNVMIYFDTETRIKLVNKFYNILDNGGYFYIGHSETIDRKHTKFKYIMPAAYKKE